MSEWQDISTAPKDGFFLAPNSIGDWMKVERYDNPFGDKNTVIHYASGRWWTPNFWMPLPTPPEKTND